MGKGKERFLPYSTTLQTVLQDYYTQYKPKEYVFEGQGGGQYCVKSAQEKM